MNRTQQMRHQQLEIQEQALKSNAVLVTERRVGRPLSQRELGLIRQTGRSLFRHLEPRDSRN